MMAWLPTIVFDFLVAFLSWRKEFGIPWVRSGFKGTGDGKNGIIFSIWGQL